MDEITTGSVWYVWGDHHRVVAERQGPFGREVRLQRVNRPKEQQPWVEARFVARRGVPSEAYGERGAA